jgi:hypothetical protein
LLTLYTTPVVYIYLDRLRTWLRGETPVPADKPEGVHATAAE